MRRILLAAALFVAMATAASAAQDKQARRFLTEAIKGDNSEMMLGGLAAQRGASPAVRAFGQMLRDDHARARADAVNLAANYGVSAHTDTAGAARKEYARLQRLHGRAFDHEFAHYMVADHRKDIAAFTHAARHDGPVGDLARRTLPILQKHLDTALSLSRP